jgi:hypothetical protein
MRQQTYCSIKKKLIKVASFVHHFPKCFTQLLPIVGVGLYNFSVDETPNGEGCLDFVVMNFVFAMILGCYKINLVVSLIVIAGSETDYCYQCLRK